MTKIPKQTAVLTGASSGIGRATAVRLARRGVNVVLAARDVAALEVVRRECEAVGGQAVVVATDVTDPEQVVALASKAIGTFGQIDIWINNVGIGAVGAFEQVPVAAHKRVIEANLLGHMYGTHAVLPHFRQRKRGLLINMISLGGWTGAPYAAAYSASKFGLRGFSESIRAETSNMPGIRVCEVYPTFVDTPGVRHGGNYTGKHLAPPPPMLDPREVATAVVNLLDNPKASTMVGSIAWPVRMAHSLAPDLSARITRVLMDIGFRRAKRVALSDGNLYAPSQGHGVDGGFRDSSGKVGMPIKAGAIAIVVFAAWRALR